MILLAVVARLTLPILYHWKPEICKAIFGLQMLICCAKETAVLDSGVIWHQYITNELTMWFVTLTNLGQIDMFICLIA